MLGYTSPENTQVHDQAGLLPPTRASSTFEEDKSDGDSDKFNSSLTMSARHLPPVYIDIQEEIERSMTKINSQSKQYFPVGFSYLNVILPIVTDLKKLHQKRLKESFFSDDNTLQMKIIETTRDITNQIKHSEKELRALGEAETDESSDEQSKSMLPPLIQPI